MKPIYLDYAAATPLDARVIAAMKPYFLDKFYNPSGLYLAAKEVKQDIENARGKVSRWLGAKPSEIIFTSGGTEANNLAIRGVMENYPGCNAVVSKIEHESVLSPASQYKNKKLAVKKDGVIDFADLKKQINNKTVLVSIMYANNEIGTIQPIRKIASVITKIRDDRQKMGDLLPIYLHTDACQAAQYLDIHASNLGVDLMTINGGKIYGPKQSGALYVSKNVRLKPLIYGGGQERGIRSGTENVPGIIGFAEALERVQKSKNQEAPRMAELREMFITEINNKIPIAVINGSTKSKLPNIISITIPGQDNERLVMELDETGIMCASGSACSAISGKPSSALEAIGLSEEESRSTIRISMGKQTSRNDILRAARAIASLIV